MENVELNLARRVLERFKLSPPVDIRKIAEEYATVVSEDTPPGVDAVCLNLKHSSEYPEIILSNEITSVGRVRFTLAHELGHILIPNHFGTFVDKLGLESNYTQPLEAQANRFASEVLLPSAWLRTLSSTSGNPAEIVAVAARRAKVSITATCIKVVSILPPGYVFAMTNADSQVLYSGISPKTFARTLPKSFVLSNPDKEYPKADEHWVRPYNDGNKLYWWKLAGAQQLRLNDNIDWKNVLCEILDDLNVPEQDRFCVQQSLSGVFGSMNSDANKRNLDAEERFEFLLQRLHQRAEQTTGLQPFYSKLLKHPLLTKLLKSRLSSL